jgi:hypothetical protein
LQHRLPEAAWDYGVMDAGVHLPLVDFGGEGFSHRRLAEAVDAARECGFAAVSANDHFVFSEQPVLAGQAHQTALLTVDAMPSGAVFRASPPTRPGEQA